MNTIDQFKDGENYVLSAHGEDNGLKLTIPPNCFIIIYRPLGEEIVCSNATPNKICNHTFKHDEYFKQIIFFPGNKFPNLQLWPLKTYPYVNSNSGIKKCSDNSILHDSNIDLNGDTKLNELVNLVDNDMSDANKKYIHILACTTKGKQSVFASGFKKSRKHKSKRQKSRKHKSRKHKYRKHKSRKHKYRK